MTPRIVSIARKVAKHSGHPIHRMAAVLLRGGAVVAVAANGPPGRGHAEARVLRPHRDSRGCHLVVFRLNGSGSSRPCFRCLPKVRRAGLDKVSFVDVDGEWRTVGPGEL